MLFCPSLYAATLTANTVPYVCQGGTSPQLCNSNMTTDSNGNVGILGTWVLMSLNTIYQAPTDGFVTVGVQSNATQASLFIVSDSNSIPTTRRCEEGGGGMPSNLGVGCSTFVRKGDYYEVQTGSMVRDAGPYFISVG